MGILPTSINPKDDDRIRRFGARRPGNTFPDGPVVGDTFWKINTADYWIWDGANWREIPII